MELGGQMLLNVPGYDVKEKFDAITSFPYHIENPGMFRLWR
jgi:hypothetical protein